MGNQEACRREVVLFREPINSFLFQRTSNKTFPNCVIHYVDTNLVLLNVLKFFKGKKKKQGLRFWDLANIIFVQMQ